MKGYVYNIIAARHFWYHLVKAELRIKYRRSTFGVAWTLFQPLLLTLLLVVVFGTIFKSPFLDFAPYVYSGLIAWDFIIGSITQGANSIINSEAYIRQFTHPLAIYTLKQSLVVLFNFLVAAIGLVVWCWIKHPSYILTSIIALPLTIALFFLVSWSLSTMSGFINTKFRDFQQFLVIIMQAIYFISPVYFEPKVFIKAGLPGLVNYNPITHLLNLIRQPLMYGRFPSIYDYLYSFGTILFFVAISTWKIIKEEKDTIFYL